MDVINGVARDELDRKGMTEQATVKVWSIPACEGTGPVTMTLRVPDVRISDSEGRYIIEAYSKRMLIIGRGLYELV